MSETVNQQIHNEINYLLSPDGWQQMVNVIQNAKAANGEAWLEYLRKNYPQLLWMCDLAANKTAEEAFSEVMPYLGEYQIPYFIARPIFFEYHAALKAEIEKKRF